MGCVNLALYDRETIGQLIWPENEEAMQAKVLLLPMIQEGVSAYIQNVETKLYLLKVNSHIIPLTVNHKEYNNSYLTSNYFVVKHWEEQLNKQKSSLQTLKKSLIKGLGGLLKAVKINKIVIINNWLLTTNIYPTLTEEEWQAVTEFLTVKFPDHALIFRSLNDYKCQELKQKLDKQRYRLLFSRQVYIYDPQQKEALSPKQRYHHRRDRKLASTEGYEIFHYKQIDSQESERLLKLYSSIYHVQHTQYSPQYTARYLQEAIEGQFLHLIGIKKDDTVQGVIGFHQRGGTLITPFFGYDQKFGAANHLYRMLTMVAIDEAETRGVHLNDGSGGEETKSYRGLKPFPEYVALYDRHLPIYRRLFWSLAEKFGKTHSFYTKN
jgi:hypothetical protein